MYRRRIIAFLIFIGVALAIVIARLSYIQIAKADHYLAGAERYLSSPKLLPAMRGKILDRNGLILAFDEPCHDLCLDFRFMIAGPRWISADSREAAAGDKLSRLAIKWVKDQQRAIRKTTGCSTEQSEQVFLQRWEKTWQLAWQAAEGAEQDLNAAVTRQVRRICKMTRDGHRDYRELYVAHPVVTGLGRQLASQVLTELPETVGLTLRPSHARHYPRRASACHVIGLTGPVAQEELRLNRPQFQPDWLTWQRSSYLSNDLIGKTGVEKMCEELLRGRRGYVSYRHGEPIDDPVEATPGADVHLTIDVDLQEELTGAFARHAADMELNSAVGAIVVLDVPTGQVLALVSVPTFDPNEYRRDYNQLVSDEILLPLRHRAVAQCYAPGSTVKPVAAMAAVADGRIAPETTFTCNLGLFPLSANGSPKCWTAKDNYGHGRINLPEAIRRSCNVYFDHVGHVMGPSRLCEWYRLFGFGALPGTGLPSEAPGLVPTDSWMRRVEGRRLSIGDAWNMAIGQGSLSASPLQVANAVATVARGGIYLSPTVVFEGGPERVTNHLPVSEANVAAVHRGMRDVVHHAEGTAHKYLAQDGLGRLDFEFCGKTGTAEVPPQKIDTDGDGRRDTEVRWGNVVWFAGFAPYKDPKIAFAVVIEYVDGGASRYAAPLGLTAVRICDQMGYVTERGD